MHGLTVQKPNLLQPKRQFISFLCNYTKAWLGTSFLRRERRDCGFFAVRLEVISGCLNSQMNDVIGLEKRVMTDYGPGCSCGTCWPRTCPGYHLHLLVGCWHNIRGAIPVSRKHHDHICLTSCWAFGWHRNSSNMQSHELKDLMDCRGDTKTFAADPPVLGASIKQPCQFLLSCTTVSGNSSHDCWLGAPSLPVL